MTPAADIISAVRGRKLDSDFLAPDELDVTVRARTSALPWRGQFTPGLPELLIKAYDSGQGLIHDPFAGSGTTLFESIRCGRPSSGTEVNPAAFLLGRVLELANFPAAEREEALRVGRARLDLELPADVNVGLFETAGEDNSPEQEAGIPASLARSSRVDSDLASIVMQCALLLSMGDKRETTRLKTLKAWKSVEELVRVLPNQAVPCSVNLGDARASGLASDSVGLTITSPPYINVFNYHQNYRPAVELLGWKVLPAARSEIGANRKHRQNRFLTVVQYAEDMLLALAEMVRVSIDGANVVLVVGRESRVRGIPFANGEIINALCHILGALVFTRWQERKFVNRFGITIYEEILTFTVQKSAGSILGEELLLSSARDVGIHCLQEALSRATIDTIGDITQAIAGASNVRPSPFPSF